MAVRVIFGLIMVTGLSVVSPAIGQVLEGEWVDRSQQRIDEVRKTPIRVIVLDEHDRPAGGARVRIEQIRHDFPLGFTLHDADWLDYDTDAPLWRCFNAIAVDTLTGWTAYDEADEGQRDAIERTIQRAKAEGMYVRWGGGISADIARNPDWLSGLSTDDQQIAIETHAHRMMRRYGWQVDQMDLYTHAVDHDMLTERFGQPMVRRLYEQAAAEALDVALSVRVHDRLIGERLQKLVATVTDWRHAFIPVDVVAIEQRVHGSLVHGPIERALTWLGELDVDVVVVGLEVGGASEVAAAVNMETLLRTLFADPTVTGIWFGGMAADEVGAPDAQLIDDAGQLTRSGQLVDQLFRQLWRTDTTLRTDEVGNIRTRVFAGTHRVTAVLPDGRKVQIKVHLPKQNEERIVVLQPLKSAE